MRKLLYIPYNQDGFLPSCFLPLSCPSLVVSRRPADVDINLLLIRCSLYTISRLFVEIK